MTKVRIDEDERWPTYFLRDDYGYEVEASPEQVERWERVAREYDAAQKEMSALHHQAEKAERERLQAEREERERQEREAAERRKAASDRMVGTVYDEHGNPVGEVRRGLTGLIAEPLP